MEIDFLNKKNRMDRSTPLIAIMFFSIAIIGLIIFLIYAFTIGKSEWKNINDLFLAFLLPIGIVAFASILLYLVSDPFLYWMITEESIINGRFSKEKVVLYKDVERVYLHVDYGYKGFSRRYYIFFFYNDKKRLKMPIEADCFPQVKYVLSKLNIEIPDNIKQLLSD